MQLFLQYGFYPKLYSFAAKHVSDRQKASTESGFHLTNEYVSSFLYSSDDDVLPTPFVLGGAFLSVLVVSKACGHVIEICEASE